MKVYTSSVNAKSMDVTEPAKIHFLQIRILCFKSVGFACRFGFVTWSRPRRFVQAKGCNAAYCTTGLKPKP